MKRNLRITEIATGVTWITPLFLDAEYSKEKSFWLNRKTVDGYNKYLVE